MTIRPISRAAVLAVAAGVLTVAWPVHAHGQDVESGPRRSAGSYPTPERERGAATVVRPGGAAPVPAERGPLGEPAPVAAPTVEGEEAEAPRVIGIVPDAAPADDPAADEASDAEPALLGSPVPPPPRRSFMPIARRGVQGGAPVPVVGSTWGLVGEAFRADQLEHPRVVEAQLNAKFELKALFEERGLTWPSRDLYFRLFKQEQVLEVWVREAPGAETYTLLREYEICAIPGRLGPKTRVDDFQAPEGFYYVQGFNPASDFHLSLRLNYPNAADRILGVTDSWGGDIYIHGGCSTVGCFPMTDEAMQQIYWLAVEARTAGQETIPVHVFPARMNDASMVFLRRVFGGDEQLLDFWDNLREGYDYFERNRRPPHVRVDSRGHYLFTDTAVGPAGNATAGTAGEGAPLGAEMTGSPEAEPGRESAVDEPAARRARPLGEPPTTLLP